MTFKVFAIEVKDFKTFRGAHSFVFPQEPGLYYLTGENKYNARLGANGTGKSTFLVDTINWCLYGKTNRGLKASEVIAWGKSSCSVSVSMLIGDDEYDVTRTQSPNSLSINGQPANQDEVDKLIRLNQEAFNCSVIIPQFGESFLDLTPSKKLEVFSQVMNLDYWLERSKRAAVRAGLLEERIHKLETHIASRQGKLEHNLSHTENLVNQESSFEQERLEEIKQHNRAIKEQQKENKANHAKLIDIAKLVKEAQTDVAEIRAAIEEANEVWQAIEKKHTQASTKCELREQLTKGFLSELKTLDRLKGTVCTTCKQEIDAKHTEKQKREVLKKQNAVLEEIKVFKATIDKLVNKREESRSEVNELVQILRKVEADFTGLSMEHRSLLNDMEGNIKAIDRHKESIVKLEKKANPFSSLIENATRQKKLLKREIKDLTNDLNEVKVEHEAVSYWVGGFKRVRLFVIEEALSALEVEINNLLVSLGLVGWTITLDVERENKSGGITKGFTVLIHSPKTDKPVKFEAWSGGETQRLRLAGDLGLANLIMEQAGLVNSIEIVDEPTTHMSEEGIKDLIETIHQRAHDTQKQIWLIDHHSMDFNGFSGTLKVTMSAKGNAQLGYIGNG